MLVFFIVIDNWWKSIVYKVYIINSNVIKYVIVFFCFKDDFEGCSMVINI